MISGDGLPKILVVEDQINWRRLYKIWLKKAYRLSFATNPAEAFELLKHNKFGVVIMDLGLPDPLDGIETIRAIQSLHKHFKVIVITAVIDRSIYLQVEEMGVYAVFNKNERLEAELPVFVRKALDMIALENENQVLRSQVDQRKKEIQIRGNSKVTDDLRKDVQQLSQADTPVLITGATGVGKNYLAKYIHMNSRRAQFPFVVLNCANFPENLIESELFGHRRGAFTGADSAKAGKFLIADKGTILLDEIGEIPFELQAKLLRVIEEQRFFPLGGQKEIGVDVRIMAATNRDLEAEIENGRFRGDLFYRLAGYRLHIPGLSTRRSDISIYFNQFVNEVCREEGIKKPAYDMDIFPILEKATWRGNFRELKNVVTRLLVFRPEKISVEMLLAQLDDKNGTSLDRSVNAEYTLKEFSAIYVQELQRKYGQKKKVADILKIDKKTLNKYLEMQVKK